MARDLRGAAAQADEQEQTHYIRYQIVNEPTSSMSLLYFLRELMLPKNGDLSVAALSFNKLRPPPPITKIVVAVWPYVLALCYRILATLANEEDEVIMRATDEILGYAVKVWNERTISAFKRAVDASGHHLERAYEHEGSKAWHGLKSKVWNTVTHLHANSLLRSVRINADEVLTHVLRVLTCSIIPTSARDVLQVHASMVGIIRSDEFVAIRHSHRVRSASPHPDQYASSTLQPVVRYVPFAYTATGERGRPYKVALVGGGTATEPVILQFMSQMVRPEGAASVGIETVGSKFGRYTSVPILLDTIRLSVSETFTLSDRGAVPLSQCEVSLNRVPQHTSTLAVPDEYASYLTMYLAPFPYPLMDAIADTLLTRMQLPKMFSAVKRRNKPDFDGVRFLDMAPLAMVPTIPETGDIHSVLVDNQVLREEIGILGNRLPASYVGTEHLKDVATSYLRAAITQYLHFSVYIACGVTGVEWREDDHTAYIRGELISWADAGEMPYSNDPMMTAASASDATRHVALMVGAMVDSASEDTHDGINNELVQILLHASQYLADNRREVPRRASW